MKIVTVMPASPLSAIPAFAVFVLPVRQAGIQTSPLHTLDSGFRRNNEKAEGVLVQGFPKEQPW